MTCRPSTVNEIGAAIVFPPSGTRQSSRPVSASSAKQNPPDAPNTNPPAVASRPLESSAADERYSHLRRPVAASSARTQRGGGFDVSVPALPRKRPCSPGRAPFAATFVKTALLSVAGTNNDPRIGSKAGFCQLVPPVTPGLVRRPAADTP